jgi:hypothetical protein
LRHLVENVAAATAAEPSAPSSPVTLRQLIAALAEAAGSRLLLFEAESRRAVWTAVYMGMLGVAAAVLLVTAWLIVAVLAIVLAHHFGLPWWWGATVLALLNLVFAWWAWRCLHDLADRLSFSATRRALVRVLRPDTDVADPDQAR